MSKKTVWLDRSLPLLPYLALVTSEAEFYAAMKHCKVSKRDAGPWIKTPHADATMHTLESNDHGLTCIVAIRPKKDTTPTEICGLLVHEAVHVWQHLKERIGEHNPSIEFEAYAIQAIAQNLIGAYQHKAKKRSKS